MASKLADLAVQHKIASPRDVRLLSRLKLEQTPVVILQFVNSGTVR